jgi:AbrB family looped-hinge helix DNA binding protein
MAELLVDEKHRVTLPRELRRHLGITAGSRLEVELSGAEIVIRKSVPVKNPTEKMWGLVPRVKEPNPKKQARRAIAMRKRLGR